MSDDIVELDDHREPQRRRSDRFVVGALLSGSLAFGIVVALARPVPTVTPRLRIQPPIFRPPGPFPRPSVIPLPAPGVWRSGELP